MGGKSHVRCKCCMFPLIPTSSHSNKKKRCNLTSFFKNNGPQEEKEHNCKRLESFVCTNVNCNVKICKQCYNSFSTEDVTTIIPKNDLIVQEDDIVNDMNEEESDSEVDSVDTDNSSLVTSDDDMNNVDELIDSMVNNTVYSEQDTSLDLTADNNTEFGFATTHSGDTTTNIVQDLRTDTVSGHVIFNQAGSCTTRRYQHINGTSRQKHIIQSLCATVPGQASPLLQPEASLFPRHFYISAQNDNCSILGARPLFLMSSKTHPYGFASTLSQARMHMTNPYSTTSTDPTFMSYYFDELGNMALSNCHSRDIFQRGFVVDDKSSTGMSVRDKGHTNLSGSVDSRKMVRNLSTSQKYIKYTWFLTFTANQSEHPGLATLHNWKSSLEWLRNIQNYESFSADEVIEFQEAMEEAYGVQIYNNWNNVKYLLLLHLKKHITVLGTTIAIFARDEYQKDAGNLCHNHLILAIDKSTLNDDSEQFIQDLIRTSVLEIIKSDVDIDRLIHNGLLNLLKK